MNCGKAIIAEILYYRVDTLFGDRPVADRVTK